LIWRKRSTGHRQTPRCNRPWQSSESSHINTRLAWRAWPRTSPSSRWIRNNSPTSQLLTSLPRVHLATTAATSLLLPSLITLAAWAFLNTALPLVQAVLKSAANPQSILHQLSCKHQTPW
jgi:hypothetical protein